MAAFDFSRTHTGCSRSVPGIHRCAVPCGLACLLNKIIQSPHQPLLSRFVTVMLECLAIGMSGLNRLEGFLNQYQTLKSTLSKQSQED